MLPEDFTLRLMHAARDRLGRDDLLIKVRDANSFVVTQEGQPSLQVPTVHVYQAYTRYPEKLDRIIEDYANGLADSLESPDPTSLPFDEARWMILPQIRQVAEDASEHKRVAQPFGHDLELGYVVESSHRVAVIDEGILARWKITADELQRLAVDNLEQKSEEIRLMKEWFDDDHPIYIFDSRDGYDATRILLEDYWRELAREVDGELFIAIPHRDLLVAFSNSDPKFYEGIQDRVLRDYGSGESPLTWKLFAVTGEGVQPHTFVMH